MNNSTKLIMSFDEFWKNRTDVGVYKFRTINRKSVGSDVIWSVNREKLSLNCLFNPSGNDNGWRKSNFITSVSDFNNAMKNWPIKWPIEFFPR